MVERRTFSVYNSAENPNMSWKDLAYMAMHIMNAELSNYNIISIQKNKLRPKPSYIPMPIYGIRKKNISSSYSVKGLVNF